MITEIYLRRFQQEWDDCRSVLDFAATTPPLSSKRLRMVNSGFCLALMPDMVHTGNFLEFGDGGLQILPRRF